jgi:hypothetical protein
MRLKTSILPILGTVTVSLILVLAFLVNNYFAQGKAPNNRGFSTSYAEQDQTKYTKLVATQAISSADQITNQSQSSSSVQSSSVAVSSQVTSSSAKPVEIIASLSNPKPAQVIVSSTSTVNITTNNLKDSLKNPKLEQPIKTETLSQDKAITEVPREEVQPIIQPKPKPVVQSGVPSSISIPAINIKDQKYAFSSLFSIDDLYQKMIYKPVMENQVAGEVCKPNSHSYIFGHSEPSSPSEVGPGTSVFGNLNLLINGDIVNAVDSQGNKCQYKITGREVITTDGADKISYAKYQQLFFPDLSQGSVLTLQTCQKGSSTVRIVYRAVMI